MSVELFYSYSHKDEGLRDELDTHLALLRRRGVVNVWHDRKITASEQWRAAIDSHLESADIVLLLVTPDFIASDYCYDVELGRALERHNAGKSRVVPVIARAVDVEGAPFAEIQALPKDAKPVTSWPNRDEAWTDVAKAIRKLAEAISASKPAAPPPALEAVAASEVAFSTLATGATNDVIRPVSPVPPSPPVAAVPASPPVTHVPAGHVHGGDPDPELHVDAAMRRALSGFQEDIAKAMDLAALQRRAPANAFDPSTAWSVGERLSAIANWKRILWVDDRPANNAGEIAAFNRMQIEVETCVSTEEALAVLAAAHDPFNLVISDWTRPAEQVSAPPAGLRLLRDIRASGLGVPVVFYYGLVSPSELAKRRELIEQAGGQGATSRPDELFELATRLLSGSG